MLDVKGKVEKKHNGEVIIHAHVHGEPMAEYILRTVGGNPDNDNHLNRMVGKKWHIKGRLIEDNLLYIHEAYEYGHEG